MTTPKPVSEVAARAKSWDRCYPGNVNIEVLVDDLTSALERIEEEKERLRDGWKEAAIAWEVCGSIHREYAKKRDPFFTTRQSDFTKAAEKARAALGDTPAGLAAKEKES